MDTKRFELFLRGTKFSKTILAELWSEMSVLEKINFMLYCRQTIQNLPDDANIKALDDESPLVRMLALKSTWRPTDEERRLIDKLKSDPHPFVRATTREFSYDELISMPHEEKLSIIALSKNLSDGDRFAKFIVENLNNKTLTEIEAGELVAEYVSNPDSANYVRSVPLDGMDWHNISSVFKAIWELTILTPPKVHDSIIWKYPLVSGDIDTIPNDIFNKMNTETLSKLVWRGYHPLIAAIRKNPEDYDEKLVKDVEDVEAISSVRRIETSEIDTLRGELHDFRKEVRELIDDMWSNTE